MIMTIQNKHFVKTWEYEVKYIKCIKSPNWAVHKYLLWSMNRFLSTSSNKTAKSLQTSHSGADQSRSDVTNRKEIRLQKCDNSLNCYCEWNTAEDSAKKLYIYWEQNKNQLIRLNEIEDIINYLKSNSDFWNTTYKKYNMLISARERIKNKQRLEFN